MNCLKSDQELQQNKYHSSEESVVNHSIELIIHIDGTQEWWQNGRRHRLDGPAIITENGDQYWYQNDQIHRLDGPAVISKNGDQSWLQNDKLHRLDGPAIINKNGSQYWYIHDKNLTTEITLWMESNQVSWPWDQSTQMFFELIWG